MPGLNPSTRNNLLLCGLLALILCFSGQATAHNVDTSDAAFLQAQSGVVFALSLSRRQTYGDWPRSPTVPSRRCFFLRGFRDVAIYVSLFALGHSLTLILGVMLQTNANPYLVDAIIGLSVVYKALENLAQHRNWYFGINTRAAVFVFGLCHGLGLATKLQQISLSDEGLLINLLAFNLGVEFGQLMALSVIVLAVFGWQRRSAFAFQAAVANWFIMVGGFLLVGIHLTGYWLGSAA